MHFGTIRISPLALNGMATPTIYMGVPQQHEGSLLMCLHTFKHKVWIEFVTANADRERRELTSAVSVRSTHITLCRSLSEGDSVRSSAALGGNAISLSMEELRSG